VGKIGKLEGEAALQAAAKAQLETWLVAAAGKKAPAK
jgi:hypothetical protein